MSQNNSKMFLGSICLSDLNEKAKAGHSAFKRGKNGKIYADIAIWVNDHVNKFGHDTSIQLSSEKDKREAEGKVYIGNAKEFKLSGYPKQSDIDSIPNDDDLLF